MYDNIFDQVPGPIGSQIRWLRKSRGWSLAELAHRAGTSAPALHRYESGWERFEVSTLKRIAQALEVTLEIRFLKRDHGQPLEQLSVKELVNILASLFQEKQLTEEDILHFPLWVIGRVLMFGSITQVRALRQYFNDRMLGQAIARRGIDARTRNYWRIILGEQNCAPESITG